MSLSITLATPPRRTSLVAIITVAPLMPRNVRPQSVHPLATLAELRKIAAAHRPRGASDLPSARTFAIGQEVSRWAMEASNGIAVAALTVSVGGLFFAHAQASGARAQADAALGQVNSARDANSVSRATSYANTIISFVSHFLDLVGQEDPKVRFTGEKKDERWAYQYWALYTIEFWYYHHRLLPVDMFTYWMGYLAEIYASDPAVYRSHQGFLASYRHTYPEMSEFFEKINDLAENNANLAERNREVQRYVEEWIQDNHADFRFDEVGRLRPPT
jgi:hypothetical protein